MFATQLLAGLPRLEHVHFGPPPGELAEPDALATRMVLVTHPRARITAGARPPWPPPDDGPPHTSRTPSAAVLAHALDSIALALPSEPDWAALRGALGPHPSRRITANINRFLPPA